MRVWIAAVVLALSAALPASAKPPLTAFGEMAPVRSAEISPDGSRIAFLQRIDDVDYLVIHDLRTAASKALAQVTDIRARHVYFAGNSHAVLIVSKTERKMGYRGRFEESAAFAINLASGKHVQLLRRTDELYPAQSGLGEIVGEDPGGQYVFMPAWMGLGSSPTRDLLKVSLENGRGLRMNVGRGRSTTLDWVVDRQGEVLAREDYHQGEMRHEIHVRAGSGWRKLFEETGLGTSLIGVSSQGDALIVADETESDFTTLREISLDTGALSPPIAVREDAEVDGVITDGQRIVHGVRFSGMRPSYKMFDPALDADIRGVVAALQGSSVWIDSFSADLSKILLLVEGGAVGQRYMLFDRETKQVAPLVTTRPDLSGDDLGQAVSIEYKARDGLTIPGVVTWPARVPADQRKMLPMVMLPHGGPEAYDSIGFDWLAQFLANEGYLVMQPNFRGSAGFGKTFREAGHREWGRKMQDDITDGVNAAIEMGWVDPNRVCIVGWSYGGYAALAGGALTPDLYRCVVSIAGVSDLRAMLLSERRQHANSKWIYEYWERLIGDPHTDRRAIEAVSPYRLAENFKAPVLLVHGTDDIVVEASQSGKMEDALKSAGKSVTYLRIKGDDHSLVENESRRQTLEAVRDFLARHIGPQATASAAD